MANRTLSRLLAVDRDQCFLAGSFLTNGTSAPLSPAGQGFSVTRTGVGTYQVQTTEPFAAIIGWDANVSEGTPTDFTTVCTQPTQVTVSGNKRWQLVVTLLSAGAAADLAAATGNAVSFFMVLQHSASKPY